MKRLLCFTTLPMSSLSLRRAARNEISDSYLTVTGSRGAHKELSLVNRSAKRRACRAFDHLTPAPDTITCITRTHDER